MKLFYYLKSLPERLFPTNPMLRKFSSIRVGIIFNVQLCCLYSSVLHSRSHRNDKVNLIQSVGMHIKALNEIHVLRPQICIPEIEYYLRMFSHPQISPQGAFIRWSVKESRFYFSVRNNGTMIM